MEEAQGRNILKDAWENVGNMWGFCLSDVVSESAAAGSHEQEIRLRKNDEKRRVSSRAAKANITEAVTWPGGIGQLDELTTVPVPSR